MALCRAWRGDESDKNHTLGSALRSCRGLKGLVVDQFEEEVFCEIVVVFHTATLYRCSLRTRHAIVCSHPYARRGTTPCRGTVQTPKALAESMWHIRLGCEVRQSS